MNSKLNGLLFFKEKIIVRMIVLYEKILDAFIKWQNEEIDESLVAKVDYQDFNVWELQKNTNQEAIFKTLKDVLYGRLTGDNKDIYIIENDFE